MKKIGSKFSNRTKTLAGITLLTGIGAAVSIVRDIRSDDIAEEAPAVLLEELPIEDAAAAVASDVEVIDF